MLLGARSEPSGDRRESGAPAPVYTLPTKQRVILEIVLEYHHMTGEACPASYLARRMRLHHSTVQEHLSVLHRKGWLTTATGPAIPRLET